MKRLIALTLLTWVSYAQVTKLPEAKVQVVQEAAKEFRSEQDREWQCYFDSKEVSLTSIMLAKVANESSYGTNWMWARYNNRWNIKWDLIWKKTWTTCGDSTCRYPIFETPKDWLKNLAMRLKNSWCKATFNSSFAYVKWPRAPRTESNVSQINRYHSRMKEVVDAYENKKDLYLVKTQETIDESNALHGIKKDTKQKVCIKVHTVGKYTTLQVDDKNWKYKTSQDIKWWDKIFTCKFI